MKKLDKLLSVVLALIMLSASAFVTSASAAENSESAQVSADSSQSLQSISITGTNNYDKAFEVLSLVNKERSAQGLSKLVMNKSLLETAMQRGAEIAVNFEHTRPDGSSCFTANSLMFRENIAVAQSSASAVMNSWMNSPGHRANILSADSKTIGIGCFEIEGVLHWVQCFGNGNDSSSCSVPANAKKTYSISLSKDAADYEFYVDLAKTSVTKGSSTSAKLYIVNPGFTSDCVPLNNTGIKWSSSSTNVATVNSSGNITGVNVGSAKITASLDYYSASATLTVTSPSQAVSYDKSVTLGVDETYTFSEGTALVKSSTSYSWGTSNTYVATVDGSCKITAKGEGSATITVKNSTGKTKTCRVTVKKAPSKVSLNKTSITLGIGETYDLNSSLPSGTVSYSVKYTSNKTSVATVKAAGGLVTAKAVGTATITAKTYNGKTATCKVTVKKAPSKVSLNKTSITLGIGETYDLNSSLPSGTASYSVKYSSNNTSVATVKAAGGLVTAKAVGTATITAKTYNGKTATCKVTVKKAPTSVSLNKTSITLKVGQTYDLNSSVPSVCASHSVVYSSSNTKAATVKAAGGLVTAKAVGTATITAKTYNGKTATCKVTVK